MKYYKRVNAAGKTMTVESYSHDADVPGALEITQEEFESFMDSLPPPPIPPDFKSLYSRAETDRERIDVLAKKLGLLED